MIEINLLPLEQRKKPQLPLERIFKAKFIFVVLGILFVLHLLLNAVVAINAVRLNRYKRKWQGLSSEKAEIDKLKSELGKIDEKIPLIDQLISNRVGWSEKLNRVSDLLIPGIWLNEITLEQQKPNSKSETHTYLMIRGSAASQNKDEPALIGRFMQNLKDDPAFSVDFTEIELGPIKKRQIAQTEIMDFILICRFKEEKLKTLLR